MSERRFAAAVLVLAGPAAAVTTITVNCPSGDLQNAIDNPANAGDTIVINGTCYGTRFWRVARRIHLL